MSCSEGLGKKVSLIWLRWLKAVLNEEVSASVQSNFSDGFFPPVAESKGDITFKELVGGQ